MCTNNDCRRTINCSGSLVKKSWYLLLSILLTNTYDGYDIHVRVHGQRNRKNRIIMAFNFKPINISWIV